MRRPNYSAVTGVTVTLVAVCAMRLAFQSLIPPPHPEIERWGSGEFVERAKVQDIRWRPAGPAAFAEAQRRTCPLLLVMGVPWSGLGREMDAALMSPEVARAVAQGFVPVRIDTARDPRWISQFLPLQRTRTGLSVGFQAWVFDLKGRLIAFIGRSGADQTLDATSVLDGLLAAQSAFSDAVLTDDTPTVQVAQEADVNRLLASGIADLSLANAARTLAGGLDADQGGWSLNGIVESRPLAIRFLQIAGDWDDASRGLRLTALSSRADWLDGGFYRLGGLRVPEYDKTAVENAQLAEALAVQDAARPDPLLQGAARRTVAWLLDLGGGDLLPGAEIGDEDERGRSRRASFSPRRLSDAVAAGALSAGDRAWAETFLGLEEGTRTPRPTVAAAFDPRLGGVLAGLRRSAGPHRTPTADPLCEPNGTVAACLLRCARLWNDRDLAATAGAIVDRLEAFRSGAGLRHALNDPSSALPYLGDALAYADAELEDYLTNGRVPSLQRGATALRNALRTFEGPEAGLFRPSPVGTTLLPGMAERPQATDDEREALCATALRLLDDYAAILGASDLAGTANDLDARLSTVADAVPAMGGALGALSRHTDPRAAFVVGPDALAVATRLARRLPNRLVVPVLGPSRPDLRNRAPGIYVVTPAGTSGPYDEAAALERLPRDLGVGL